MGTLRLYSDKGNTDLGANMMSHILRSGRNTMTIKITVDFDSNHDYMRLLDDANSFRYEDSPEDPFVFGQIETRLIIPRMTFIIVEYNYT